LSKYFYGRNTDGTRTINITDKDEKQMKSTAHREDVIQKGDFGGK
jgi:hypothetical protein